MGLLVLFLYLFLLVKPFDCNILSISLGAWNIRASYPDPKTGLPITVEDELGSRSFINSILIDGNSSKFCTFAMEQGHKFPLNVYSNLKMLLGFANEPQVVNWRKNVFPWHNLIALKGRPYGFSLNSMAIEELLSLQLDHVKKHVEKSTGNEISQLFLVMPSESFGFIARTSLMDAATLSGFRLVGYGEESDMAAKYLFSVDDDLKPSNHLLIDVGYSHVTFSLYSITNEFNDKEKVNSNSIFLIPLPHIKSLVSRNHVLSSNEIGTFVLDLIIRDLVWKKFIGAHASTLNAISDKIDWVNSTIPEITLKIKELKNDIISLAIFGLFTRISEQTASAKEFLSSLPQATIQLITPIPGVEEFICQIKKEEFLYHVDPFVSKFRDLFTKFVNETQNQYPITNVFLLGGGTRMPFIKEIIQNLAAELHIKGKVLSRNNEEATITGASQYSSSIFYPEKTNSTVSIAKRRWPFSISYSIRQDKEGDEPFIDPSTGISGLKSDPLTTRLISANDPLISDCTQFRVFNVSGDFIVDLYISLNSTLLRWGSICTSEISDILLENIDQRLDRVEFTLSGLPSGLLEPGACDAYLSNGKIYSHLNFNFVDLFPSFSHEVIHATKSREDDSVTFPQTASEVISHLRNSFESFVLHLQHLMETPLDSSNLLSFLSPEDRELLQDRMEKINNVIDSINEIPVIDILTYKKLLTELLDWAHPRKELYDTLQDAVQRCVLHTPANIRYLDKSPYKNPKVEELWFLFDVENTDKINNLISLLEKVVYCSSMDRKTRAFISSGLIFLYIESTNINPLAETSGCSIPSDFWNESFFIWLNGIKGPIYFA